MEQLLNNPIFFLLITAWSMFWKGWALWWAAKNDQKYWFIAILIINSLGILEIAYLFRFAKKKILWEKVREKLPWTR